MSEHRILVIEDDNDHQFIIGECFKEHGFTDCHFAPSGEKGLELFDEVKPDVVLTDTNLPGMDGFEVCKHLKAKDKNIKVVIMTGHINHVDFPKAQSVGCDEYRVKTPNCGEVIWGVRRCLA